MNSAEKQHIRRAQYHKDNFPWWHRLYHHIRVLPKRVKYTWRYGLIYIYDWKFRARMNRARSHEKRKLFEANKSEWRRQVIARDGRVCRMCPETENLTLDHIVPLGQGGADAPSNLQLLCRPCHDEKDGIGVRGPKCLWCRALRE